MTTLPRTDDLPEGLPIVRHFVAIFVHDPKLSGTDEFDALARLDPARSSATKSRCSGSGSQTVIRGEVSVSP